MIQPLHRFYALLLTVIFAAATAVAQIITTDPSPLQSDSRDIVITFHADQGNKGLAGLGPDDAVYAHTGVITNTSASSTDWQYAPTWLDNSAKYKLTYVSADTWQLNIGDIRTYYGITDPSVVVRQLMFVFRNANGSREGKTAQGGDISVDVFAPGLQVSLSSNATAMGVVTTKTVSLRAESTTSSSLSISIDGETIATADNATVLNATYDLAPGQMAKAIAMATNGSSSATDTISLATLSATEVKAYPASKLRQGVIDNGSDYIFCVAAPGKNNVTLIGSWNDYTVDPATQLYHASERITLPADTSCMKNAYMLAQPYYWINVPKDKTGTDFTYFYLIDGETAVSDPYATLILDPNNDRYIPYNVFPGLPEYPASLSQLGVPLAWHTTRYNTVKPDLGFTPVDADRIVVYELLLRDFTSSPDGGLASGNIRQAMERLDYLKELGVNAIELMPVMEFGGNNSWGYNPNFYFAPDKAYGTPDDYRTFIAQAHARGMAVILDVVFNQADSYHPWWNMYTADQNPFFNASAPHSYNVLNDWNQSNPLVEQQWVDVLTHWIEQYGADGYRFDLVKGLGDNCSYGTAYNYSSNTFANPSESATNRLNQSRIDRMSRLHAAMRNIKSDAIFINEDLATAAEENLLGADGDLNWANINNASCQFAMGYQNGSDLNRFYAPLDGNRTFGTTISYAESHDEERMAYKQSQWAHAALKADPKACMRRLGSVAAQMLMAPGAHMIWQFQELGDAQPVKAADGSNDTSPRNAAWSLLEDPDHADLMHTYADLMALRAKAPHMFGREAQATLHCSQNDWTYGRTITLSNPADGSILRLCVNPNTDRDITVDIPDGMCPIVASAGIDLTAITSVSLPAGAFVVMSNDSTLGLDPTDADLTGTDLSAVFDTGGRYVGSSLSVLAPGIYIAVYTDGRSRRIAIR